MDRNGRREKEGKYGIIFGNPASRRDEWHLGSDNVRRMKGLCSLQNLRYIKPAHEMLYLGVPGMLYTLYEKLPLSKPGAKG